MKNYRWLALVLILSLTLSACGPAEPPRPGIDVPLPQVQSAAPVSQETPTLPADIPAPVTTVNLNPTETPTETPGEMPVTDQASEIFLAAIVEYPEEMPLYAFTEVSFFITPSPGLCAAMEADKVKVDEIEIALNVSMTTLDIEDADPAAPGLQVSIDPEYYPNPETLQVLENGTDDLWVIHYHVKGLDYPTINNCLDLYFGYLKLFTLSLRAVEEGVGEITISSFVARTTDGKEIPVEYPGTSLITIVSLPTSTPVPVTPEPVLTQPAPQPTANPSSDLPVIVPAILQEGVYYRILPGENLFRIGLRFGVNWQTIAQVNGIVDERFVPAGMILYIPVAAPIGSSAYYIRRGDTLYSICRGLNLRVVDVAALNGIPAPYNYIRADTWLMLAP